MSGGDGERGRDATAASAPDDAAATGAPATRRNRLRSAALWGAVGGFAFLVAAQGYLLVGGSFPFGYAWLFGLAAVVAGGVLAVAYLAEHRIARRGAKRRT
ncbi:hypothetical protein SAMN04488066_10540 [Halorubrum aquaticum]|uniref:DUF7981 domain-containing protein n=1 Tax=Halorubrum aquaticum TaxID=387340 RepID=A0A1I3ABE9_9EURY|nr:hypothetical protein [Halorubrum aquaticum]SFH47417.1 hypothetical protein SAMN04488066_10540 [Halorubrum aquaticum]